MIKLLDKNSRGYLDFKDFSKVFAPDMSEKLVRIHQNDINIANCHTQPAREMNTENIKRHHKLVDDLKEIKKEFMPDEGFSKYKKVKH